MHLIYLLYLMEYIPLISEASRPTQREGLGGRQPPQKKQVLKYIRPKLSNGLLEVITESGLTTRETGCSFVENIRRSFLETTVKDLMVQRNGVEYRCLQPGQCANMQYQQLSLGRMYLILFFPGWAAPPPPDPPI